MFFSALVNLLEQCPLSVALVNGFTQRIVGDFEAMSRGDVGAGVTHQQAYSIVCPEDHGPAAPDRATRGWLAGCLAPAHSSMATMPAPEAGLGMPPQKSAMWVSSTGLRPERLD